MPHLFLSIIFILHHFAGSQSSLSVCHTQHLSWHTYFGDGRMFFSSCLRLVRSSPIALTFGDSSLFTFHSSCLLCFASSIVGGVIVGIQCCVFSFHFPLPYISETLIQCVSLLSDSAKMSRFFSAIQPIWYCSFCIFCARSSNIGSNLNNRLIK